MTGGRGGAPPTPRTRGFPRSPPAQVHRRHFDSESEILARNWQGSAAHPYIVIHYLYIRSRFWLTFSDPASFFTADTLMRTCMSDVSSPRRPISIWSSLVGGGRRSASHERGGRNRTELLEKAANRARGVVVLGLFLNHSVRSAGVSESVLPCATLSTNQSPVNSSSFPHFIFSQTIGFLILSASLFVCFVCPRLWKKWKGCIFTFCVGVPRFLRPVLLPLLCLFGN